MKNASFRMKRILIIHQEPVEARIAGRILSEAGCDVQIFLDSLEGLHQAIESPPDLVLAALEMTELNGDELCVHLRSRPETRTVPVILLSDRSASEGREIAEFSGAADHVETRITAEELVGAVWRVLRGVERSRKAFRTTPRNETFHSLQS
jgi:two-component system phosphate regulon response regulator PhoB